MKRKKALAHRFRWSGIAAAAIAIIIVAQGCAMHRQDFEGTWVVTETLPTGISAMQQAQARKHLGLSVTYLDDQAQLGQQHCTSPRYTSRDIQANEFSAHYHIPSESLFGNNDSVREVQVVCDEPGVQIGQTLLLQPNDTAYTTKDGVFFRLEKAEPQAQTLI